jgi:hypothetical protein
MAQAEAFAAKHGLPKDQTWRSWENGPSKIFLNDLEQRFNTEMIAHLRAQGVKVPIITTSTWGLNPLSSLPALTAGNIIDAHSYGGIGELENNPVYAPNMVHWIAAAQVAGKPLSVTEWNVVPFPVPDRHTIPLYVTAFASLHGWDALMQYAYSQVPLNAAGSPSNWHAFNDPALMATRRPPRRCTAAPRSEGGITFCFCTQQGTALQSIHLAGKHHCPAYCRRERQAGHQFAASQRTAMAGNKSASRWGRSYC